MSTSCMHLAASGIEAAGQGFDVNKSHWRHSAKIASRNSSMLGACGRHGGSTGPRLVAVAELIPLFEWGIGVMAVSDRNECTKPSPTDMRSCGQNVSSLPNMSIASGGAPRYLCCRLHGALNGNSDRYCSTFPNPRISSIVGVPITSNITFS